MTLIDMKKFVGNIKKLMKNKKPKTNSFSSPCVSTYLICYFAYTSFLSGKAMARGPRGGRSISLVNLHGPAGDETVEAWRRHTSGDSASANTFPTTASQSGAVPQALGGEVDIFEHGSPIVGVGDDPSILDEDSNDSKHEHCDSGGPEQMHVDSIKSSSNSDPIYHQCKVARHSGFKDKLVSVSVCDSFGSTVLSPSAAIGSLCDHANLSKTFHGSRLFTGNTAVNQSLSVSFDPAKLTCVSCKHEHSIVTKKPVTVLFSDQNFVSSMETDNSDCLNIVRLEDACLTDLLNMAKEMFERITLPEGSVFLFGSASFLSRVGTCTYAREWISIVTHASSIWRGIKVCPLIPLIVSRCPGTLAREILELATWLEDVYDNNPLGLLQAWSAVVAATDTCSEGATPLQAMDAYKLPLPTGLSLSSPLRSMTFCSNSTRPVTLNGLPKDTLSKLLNTLINTIHRNFQSCARPEIFLVRTTPMVSAENCGQRVVLVGASNLKNSASHFSSSGYDVRDLTISGWIASPENIENMIKKISTIEESSGNIFVFDLFGNSAYRFEQFDGTQSLPYKVGNKYHLAGNVVTCMPTTFKKFVEGIILLLEAKKSSVGLIIPPLPRYLFAGFCEQKDHCKNVSEQNHPRKMLTDIIGLRNSLKKLVTGSGIANVRVLDACCVTGCKSTANIEQRLIGLKSVMVSDNVHYLSEGYANLVENCTAALQAQGMAEMAAKSNNKASQFFWRGFRSPVGAKAPAMPVIALGTGFTQGRQG
jgi:hypothetical protein